MTGVTFFIDMFSEQRKTSQVMIEYDVFSPRNFLVAVRAVRSLSAFMHIVFGMAAVASGFQRNVVYWLDVTFDALRFPMRALQRVFGIKIVIEST